jgi:hypothetical protein
LAVVGGECQPARRRGFGFAKPRAFVLESIPMSLRFYAYFSFFSRLAAEGTG